MAHLTLGYPSEVKKQTRWWTLSLASGPAASGLGDLELQGVVVQPVSWQLRTGRPLAHPSPSTQWDGEEKWTKGGTCGLR